MFTLLGMLAVPIILLQALNARHELKRQHTDYQRLGRTKELWKTYALALEVQLESVKDFNCEVPNEGCMTRSRRREKINHQAYNAYEIAEDARIDLIIAGEYDTTHGEDDG